MAYTRTNWNVGDPITQEKMNKIEQGIVDASSMAESNKTDITTAKDDIGNLQTTASNLNQAVANAQSTASTALSATAAGNNAWTYVSGAMTFDQETGEVTKNLATRFTEDESNIASATTNIGLLHTEITSARGQKVHVGNSAQANNLKEKLDDMDTQISINKGAISSAQQDYNNAKGTYNNLQARLDANDTAFGALKTEVENARDTYGDVDARFDADETRIGNLESDKIPYSDIVDNLNQTDTNKTLSANQGNVIKRTLGAGFDTEHTVATAISTAQSNAQSYSDSNKVDKTDIYNGIDYTTDDQKVLDARVGKTLADRIDAIDNSSTGTVAGLDERITDIETEITDAHRTDDDTLDGRFDAIEANITTIANELAMVDNGAISDTNTRIDRLNDNVLALGKEVGMLSEETTLLPLSDAIDRSTTRIDALQTEVETARGNAASLDARLDNIDSSISNIQTEVSTLDGDLNTATTGIKARVTALETNKADESDLTTLAGRVTTLENEPKSATVIVPAGQITYDEETGIPTIYTDTNKTETITPTEDADYLLADANGKYFYWKYIGTAPNGTWELISGGGGGGTGTSSGKFAASLEATDIPNPNANTDYFVGNNTIGYTHYRYVIPEGEENGSFVRILPRGLIADAGLTATGGLTAHTLEDTETNIFNDFIALKTVSYDVVQRNGVDTTVITFVDTNGISHDVDVVGGGGGGSAQTVRLNNAMSSLNITVPDKEGVVTTLRAKAIVKDGSEIDTSFSAALNVATQYTLDPNGAWTNFTTQQVQNNVEFGVNISSILRTGVKTYVRLVLTTVIEEATVTRTVMYEVSKVEMSISAINFNPAVVRTTDFNFAYRCMGSGLTKVIHFLIDGEDAITPVTTTLHNDRDQQTIPVTGLTPGMHSFRVYFTVDDVESNVLNYYILYNNDSSRVAPMVALAAANDTITYGDDLQINYTVATIGSETTESVLLELFTKEGTTETLVTSTTLENVTNEQELNWRPVDYPESGTAYVRATATHTVDGTAYTDSKTISITINALETTYDLSPAGERSLIYSYTTYGRSNNDVGKESYTYTYRTIHNEDIIWTTNFNNFNWSGDGYKDGALLISGGATLTANITPFQTAKNGYTLENTEGIEDISQNGRTIEIEYEVQSATDLNDIIIDCMADTITTVENGVIKKGGTGFQVTPQSCYLLRNGTTVNTDDTGFILNESDIAAAYLTPGTRLHLAFVIEPWASELAYDNSYHQSVNIYVNGEFANACPYVRGTADFGSTATLRIGSASCIIKLYQIKVYNRGLTHSEILQNYKMAPATTRDKLVRFEDNDILNDDGKVDYEKARTKYTCLLLTGPEPKEQDGIVINPTISPYKGYPSPAHRRDKKTNEAVGKTESGVTLTKANPNKTEGYDIEFDLRDKVPTDQSIEVPEYIGDRGAYVSSNNVQGTSSQKYPVHNLKIYLAKWQGPKTTTEEVALQEGEDTTGLEIVEHDGVQYKVVTKTSPAEIKKVKYSLKGKDENGDDIGSAESTLCWKADYMSTDHANTFNANIADKLFTDVLPGASWGPKHQNVVYGIRCLLFQKQGDNAPEFLGDGCLNNDKGNNKTYSLERNNEDGKSNDTLSQKWEFTNNSDDLGYFKTDTVFRTVGEGANAHIQAKDAFESTYPDEGDLKDAGVEPNYNHLQILLTWLSKRANYWDETDPDIRATKKQIFIDEFTKHFNMNHALTYYLFSEYIALCDNRVKNMFLRSDNVTSETVLRKSNAQPIFEGNSNPNADFFKEIDAIDTGETQQVAIEDPDTHEITYETQPIYKYELHNRDDIDWENSTFAVWAPVLYDLDSCFGVENVGYIRVRYDANWDYTWNGAPQFNGYDSRLWLQFADCFDTEIKAAALPLYNRADGLNYTNFYRQQITGNLSNISPALSNQDMLVKFDKPWSEGFINYSLAEPAMETPYYKYLQRGSRTAQKTAFMNMRSKLLSSKYGANEFTNDAIKFRTGVPVGQTNLADTKITIIANQAMYPGVAYGDNKAPTRAIANGGKVNAGQPCDIQATSPVQGNDGIFICGASILTDIGDLSAFRPYQIDVGAGVNLKRLIVGSNAAGYTNGNTDTFMNLNKCVLLEEVNIQNCSNVATLDLSNNALIKRVYAAGSGATTIIFPNGGVLTTVEYGANTGNITLLNQGSLTNFVYENSANNNYGSLTKLWVENTPNVPIVDIINKALGSLTAGVRLTGINLDLGDDPTFLQTITSNLAEGKYINSTGTMIAGNTDYPYISGTVRINSIRASLLAKIHELYPNLTVNVVNNIVTEYTITYQNYDGTLLYTDYRTGDEHYLDPVYDINPITDAPYITMPEKPEDAQYKYKFGTYSNGTDYDKYSGWVRYGTTTSPLDDDFVSGNTIFVAYYPTTTIQSYTVTWYEEPNGTPIRSYTANYGIDISTYQQPEERGDVRRTKVVNGVKKVFKGWNRPVGKLTSNIDVYAQWETSTIDNAVSYDDIDMSTLSAADIYAISTLGAEAKRRILEDRLGNDPIFIRMGQDFNYETGVNTYDLLNGADSFQFSSSTTEAKIYDGAHALGEIRPLAVNGDWTLAIDYKFLLNASVYSKGAEFVLASCYKNANSTIQGFKLSLIKNSDTNSPNQAVRISWGTATETIDYVTIDTASADAKQYSKSYRNMVVLRHSSAVPANLYVYYLAPDISNQSYAPYGSDYGTQITSTTLTWSNINTLDTPLILGGNYAEDTTSIENVRSARVPAKGIIYWAKYWDADLGAKNCMALASWPHETVPFYLSGYNNNTSPSRQIVDTTELSFIAAQGLGDRYMYARTGELSSSTTEASWRYSRARNLCNGILYNAMPVAYQSILKHTAIESVAIDMNQTVDNVSLVTSTDYLYLPAEREVSPITPSNAYKIDEIWSEWSSPWPWMQAANIKNVYQESNVSGTLVIAQATNIAPFLYRFSGFYITPTARIYNINVDPYNNGSTWTYNNNQISVQSGDVWINNNVAYMYFTTAEINNNGIYVDIVNGGGGWKKADLWNIRTYNIGANYSSEMLFERIEDDGTLNTSPNTSANDRYKPRLLCPEFSI